VGVEESSVYSLENTTTGWQSFECGGSQQWRHYPDGTIEIDGEGFPSKPWTTEVDRWIQEIGDSADKWGVPAAWVAAIMAIESGGRNVGDGLMQVLPSTASSIEGRTITRADLVGDPALAVDLGTKYFRGQLDGKYLSSRSLPTGGSPVKAAVAYNAGGVYCGTGGTEMRPKEPCPSTGWNVIIGCARTGKRVDPSCSPSTEAPGQYVCSSDYPRRFIQYTNTAVSRGWGDRPPGWDPLSRREPADGRGAPPWAWLLGLSVGAVSYAAVRYGLPALARWGMRERLW
jgi:hypothetical protein